MSLPFVEWAGRNADEYLEEWQMKRLVIIICLMLLPLGLFVAAWQAFSFYQIHSEVALLEAKQQDLIEANKRLIAEYSARTAPRVIEERARKELNMDWPRQDQLVNLRIKQNGGTQ